MSSTIQIRVDDELKSESDRLFRELGTDTTSAIRIFLTQAVASNGFPFAVRRAAVNHPYAPLTEAQILDRLENSRNNAMQGENRPADEMIADMRKRYGL